MSSPDSGAPTLRFALVTVHPDATEETDRVGGFVRQRLQRHGHKLVLYRIVPPKPAMVREGITKMEGRVDVAVFNGGAGIGAAGVAVDALTELVPHELPGFATLLTQLHFAETGAAAQHYCPFAGLRGDTLYAALPSDLTVARLALDQLLLPDLRDRLPTLRAARQGTIAV
jgi:molybdopterin adenylyltransferase